MLVLHEVLQDGTVRHGPMSRRDWEASLRTRGVSRRWAHSPDDCHDPVQRLFDELRARGRVTVNDIGPELASMGFTHCSHYLNSVAHVPEKPTFGDPSTKPPEQKPTRRDPAPVQQSLF